MKDLAPLLAATAALITAILAIFTRIPGPPGPPGSTWASVNPAAYQFDTSCEYRWFVSDKIDLPGYSDKLGWQIYATSVSKNIVSSSNGIRLFWIKSENNKLMWYNLSSNSGISDIKTDQFMPIDSFEVRCTPKTL